MFHLNVFKPGSTCIKNIRDFLQKNLRHTKFEELSIPFYVTATNFINGRQTIFNTGNIIDAVIAASSIPALFPSVNIEGIPYVDGGLSNNLPVEPFADKKNETICIYVNPIKPFNPKESTLETMDRSIHLSFRGMVRRSAEGCCLYIEPGELSKYGLFDIHKLSEIFDIGYSYTNELLKNTKI
jgi:NTE family protein